MNMAIVEGALARGPDQMRNEYPAARREWLGAGQAIRRLICCMMDYSALVVGDDFAGWKFSPGR
jgi:hypothetical protein